MLGIVYKVDRLRAFGDKILCSVIDETTSINQPIKYLYNKMEASTLSLPSALPFAMISTGKMR